MAAIQTEVQSLTGFLAWQGGTGDLLQGLLSNTQIQNA